MSIKHIINWQLTLGLSFALALAALAFYPSDSNPSSNDYPPLNSVSTSQPDSPSFRSIELIKVGDRVLTGLPSDDESPTQVDTHTWKKLTLSTGMTWEDGTEDILRIETLQPPEWLKAHQVRVGANVPVPVDVVEMGGSKDLTAIVEAIQECPLIQSGRGRVVLTTTNHLSPTCRCLEVRSQDGTTDRIETTDLHPFWSESRQDWVKAYRLHPGEKLKGRAGAQLTLASSSRLAGIHTVYNMTVEADHIYRVSQLEALVHNTRCSPPTRRTQSAGDVDFPNERAARREAMRRYDVQTSEPNNYDRHDVHGKNSNLKGPNGEPSEVVRAKNLHDDDVEIQHHKWGHQYTDKNQFEWPHYQGPDGEHLNYPKSN